MRLCLSYLWIFSLLQGGEASSQPSPAKIKPTQRPLSNFSLQINPKHPALATIKFPKGEMVSQAAAANWLAAQMHFRKDADELRSTGKPVKTKDNWEVSRYQQYYKGIPVKNGATAVLSYKGISKIIQTEFYTVPDNTDVTPSVSETAASEKAVQYVQKNIPCRTAAVIKSGKADHRQVQNLCLAPSTKEKEKWLLCYQVKIETGSPYDLYNVLADAKTGEVISCNSLVSCGNKKQGEGHQANGNKEKVFSSLPHVTETTANSESNNQDHKLQSLSSLADGQGDTRYSGNKSFKTDDAGTVAGKPFRLLAIGYDIGASTVDIFTRNYQNRTVGLASDGQATDFSDNDNNWNEYSDADIFTPNLTRSGVDVHFNMQQVIDYWINTHARQSWDDNGARTLAFVNAEIDNSDNADNALWNGTALYFGNGSFSSAGQSGYKPVNALDVCAHEFGHAVLSSVAGEIPAGTELRALDEGLGDIWAACADKYYNDKFSDPFQKQLWIMGEQVSPDGTGIRNLGSPKSKDCPDTYKGDLWDANGEEHTNSGPLSKWFYLLCEGGSGINDNGLAYDITGIGIQKAESLVYKSMLQITVSTDYASFMDIAITTAKALVDNPDELVPFTDADVSSVIKAWAAAGLSQVQVFDMTNQPSFTTNNFSSIAVGKNGYVWAGTNKEGLYKFNGSNWEKAATAVSSYNINDIKADKKGGIWVAESGKEAELNAGGGVYHYPDTVFAGFTFYDESEQLPTRNVQGIFIDTAFAGQTNPRVWSACLAQNDISEFTGEDTLIRGGIAYGVDDSGRFIKKTGEITATNGGAQTIGGNNTEIWAFVNANAGGNQVLRYNAVSGNYIGAYNNANLGPFLYPGFSANAIYFDANNNKWIGLAFNGCVVQDNTGIWKSVNHDNVFAGNTLVKSNAVAGNKDSIYIGTSTGLIIYNNKGLDDEANFRKLTVANGLPSNEVNGVCIDTARGGIWLATSKGIAFIRQKDDRSITVTTTQTSCPDRIKIVFKTTGAFYNSPQPNKFIAELSNENGEFSNPVLLKVTSAAPQAPAEFTDSVSFPAGLPVSDKYRVRVRSINPEVSGKGMPLAPLLKTLPTSPSPIQYADYECTNNGWTDYHLADGTLLLSIKKNGNNIGNVQSTGSTLFVGVGTTDKAGTGRATQVNPSTIIATQLWSMNRFWTVTPLAQPASKVGIRFYYNDDDLFDVNGSNPSLQLNHRQLVFFKTDINPDPSSPGFQNNTVIKALYNVGGLGPDESFWVYTNLGNGKHMAEFEVGSFSGGGGGYTEGGGPLTITKTFTVKNGNWSDPSTWSTGTVPTGQVPVEILHDVKVDIIANCKTIKVQTPGKITVNTGFSLKVHN